MSEESYLRVLAKHSDVIRSGAIAHDYRTGQCGPVQATQLRSWGAACPPGWCPPENLPGALNRYFAGDRSGCREIPYGILFEATSSATLVVDVTVERTSKITMCPTRLIAFASGARGQWEIAEVEFGNQNQLVGGPVAADVFERNAFQLVPMVPDCLKAGQPFSITASLLPETTPTARQLWLVFIGPMVG